MSISFACSRSEFKPWISLLILCLVDPSNIESGMLMSPTIIVWESKSLCKSLRTCLIYLGAPVLGPYIFRIINSSCCIDPLPLCNVLFVSFDLRRFKVYFIRDENSPPAFFLLSICMVNLPPSLYFEPFCILACEMDFLDTAH